MASKRPLGIMGSNPDTGECIAAFSTAPDIDEQAELMALGTVFERKSLAEVKDAFCEVHASRRVVARGPSIGRYLDRDIPAWIETGDGVRHEYVGTCGPVVDFSTVQEGQLALAPGLLYQGVSLPTLSGAQQRVMTWLGKGWEAQPGAGSTLLVNGQRVCNIDTMISLFRQGLVIQDNQRCWRATESGKTVAKQLRL